MRDLKEYSGDDLVREVHALERELKEARNPDVPCEHEKADALGVRCVKCDLAVAKRTIEFRVNELKEARELNRQAGVDLLEREGQIIKLRAELERRKLKWSTTRPPDNAQIVRIADVPVYLSKAFEAPGVRYAGPIELPEEA